ncbi:adenosine deaminase [Mycobacterium sp. 21AC1]|uniref:adenosine deaminase n=1 Tax=[Mycobacterium] appelbergii TaxID=2939269 RepID=UPI00293933B6|nr:adenosine deaminase [Mycobacterium sp. 21AC1]MDV3126521.1 adenosine deaminase [Mycobacterium sp. 21AC1]
MKTDREDEGRRSDLVAQLPKVELHVHLEGTLEPSMMLALAGRNGVDLPWSSLEELQREYDFDGLEHFLKLLFLGAGVLRRRRDFHDLTYAYLSRASADGVTRTEMFFGPQTFLDTGVEIDEQLGGVFDAIEHARTDLDIDAAVILTAQRHRTESAAMELVDMTESWHRRILGFGLGGAERGNPPSKFEQYFARCRELGLRTTIHAGEEGSAENVREALELCKPDRIDHGVAAATDANLVKQLADERIPLTMCPLSNQRLRVTPDLREHPLLGLYRAGVLVTVNSDDPPYFGGYINDNYRAIGSALDLGPDQIAGLARNSFSASFADARTVAAGTAAIDDVVNDYLGSV